MARLSRLSAKGYRSIGERLDITFPEGRPLVLVGENNAGKSNIVRALNLMLGRSPHRAITNRRITNFWPRLFEPDSDLSVLRERGPSWGQVDGGSLGLQ